mmetsp:Transcript_1134/g.1742  ORF Transcript_1134/g.1742 Transcript_1134/m.1742 type:complete len:141 (-) Transcript_1134:21-443(-)|eukprot:CAMPEP_0184553160 /NCGR_PEP_ID=MMETSP0199_2-20130426/31123_1 /TAXON_ID=1112570 /ORGANISM="Thraustochytrium sp., Strain LLF1b" /LENGTH=140 /DNA_ID=CAMNT_0026948837 /DNA_START=69 /DNA_END=491 /DNA_ORIENTATION=-
MVVKRWHLNVGQLSAVPVRVSISELDAISLESESTAVAGLGPGAKIIEIDTSKVQPKPEEVATLEEVVDHVLEQARLLVTQTLASTEWATDSKTIAVPPIEETFRGRVVRLSVQFIKQSYIVDKRKVLPLLVLATIEVPH